MFETMEKVSKEKLSASIRSILQSFPTATYREVGEKLKDMNLFVPQPRVYYFYNKIRDIQPTGPIVNNQVYIKKETEMDLSNPNLQPTQGIESYHPQQSINAIGMPNVQTANNFVSSSIALDAQNMNINGNGVLHIQAANDVSASNIELSDRNINDNDMLNVRAIDDITLYNAELREQNGNGRLNIQATSNITSSNGEIGEQNISINEMQHIQEMDNITSSNPELGGKNGNDDETLQTQITDERNSINIKFYNEMEYNIKKRLLEKKELELIKQEEVAKRKLELVNKELQITKRQANLKKMILEIQSKLKELQKLPNSI